MTEAGGFIEVIVGERLFIFGFKDAMFNNSLRNFDFLLIL